MPILPSDGGLDRFNGAWLSIHCGTTQAAGLVPAVPCRNRLAAACHIVLLTLMGTTK